MLPYIPWKRNMQGKVVLLDWLTRFLPYKASISFSMLTTFRLKCVKGKPIAASVARQHNTAIRYSICPEASGLNGWVETAEWRKSRSPKCRRAWSHDHQKPPGTGWRVKRLICFLLLSRGPRISEYCRSEGRMSLSLIVCQYSSGGSSGRRISETDLPATSNEVLKWMCRSEIAAADWPCVQFCFQRHQNQIVKNGKRPVELITSVCFSLSPPVQYLRTMMLMGRLVKLMHQIEAV